MAQVLITAQWNASAKTRKREMVATGHQASTTREFTIDLAELTPQQRSVILVYLDIDKVGWQDLNMCSSNKFSEDHAYRSYLKSETIYFDEQPTIEQIIEWIVSEVAEANEAKAFEAKIKAEKAAEEQRLRELYNEKLPQAEKEAWIAEHGSDRLRRGIARGHDCQRCYVVERAALEAPGFTVDFEDAAGWKERTCPTTEALDAAEEAEKLELGQVAIVWLTKPAQDKPRHEEYCDEWEPWEEREAVVIRKYLQRYDLVKEL